MAQPPIHLCIEAGLSAINVNTLPAVMTANEFGLNINKKKKKKKQKTKLTH